MRIVFLVNRDVESNLALNLLLPEIHPSVVGIFLSERVGAKTAPPRMLGQLAFIEQDLFNYLAFPLVEASPQVDDRFAGFGKLGERFGIPVQALGRLSDPVALQKLRDARADLFVSIRFGMILDAGALGLPPLGVLNLHSGLLPQYRGVLATFRALLHGDAEIGCTLHWIDSPGIDVGPIIATAKTAVMKERSLLWHILSLYPPGAQLTPARSGGWNAASRFPGQRRIRPLARTTRFPRRTTRSGSRRWGGDCSTVRTFGNSSKHLGAG